MKDATRMIDETECDEDTDRNPIVNGRFTAITELIPGRAALELDV